MIHCMSHKVCEPTRSTGHAHHADYGLPELLVCASHTIGRTYAASAPLNYLFAIRTVLVRRVIDCAPPQHYFRSALAPLVDRIIQSAALSAIFARGPLTNGPTHHKWCSLPHYLCAAFIPFGVYLYTVRPFRTICMWGPLHIFVNYYNMIITMEFPPLSCGNSCLGCTKIRRIRNYNELLPSFQTGWSLE